MESVILKILRFFTLNKIVKNKEVKTLLINIALYIGIGFGLGLYKVFVGKIPLLGNLSYNVAGLYKIYAWVGAILAAIQCLGNDDYSDIEYVTIEDIKNLWNLKNGKIAIIAATAILCLVPNINRALTVGSNDKKEDKVASAKMEVVSEIDVEEESENYNENEVVEEASTESSSEQVSVSEETKLFYENAKGSWSGKDIWGTFDIVNDVYCFAMFSQESLVMEYDTEEINLSDDKLEAVIVDRDTGLKYDVVILEDVNGRKMKIRKQNEGEWFLFSQYDSASTYDEFMNDEECKVVYIKKDSAWYKEIDFFDLKKENLKYAYIDVSEETEGDELVIQKGGDHIDRDYYIFGIEDDIVKCLYVMDCYQKREYYEAENKELWGFYYGGTSGGHHFFRYAYEPDTDMYEYVSVEEHNNYLEKEMPYFAPLGSDYEQAKQQEAKELAESTITFDESNVITADLQTYSGIYSKDEFEIEMKTVDEDICSLTFYFESTGGTTSSTGLGSRVKNEQIPEGMVVYAVSGLVNRSSGLGRETLGYTIMLVLKPDGTIFIENVPTDGAAVQLKEGTYCKVE